jgi:2-keto-3-deoxy-6-phosphogluconate aldolase
VAVTVTVALPVAAVLLADRVSVELPLPGAAIEVGLKLAVTPAGSPEAESETAELNPPLTVVEMVLLPDAPWAIERLVGEALTLKSGCVTVSAIVTVWVTPPPVAVMVTVALPVVAVLLADRVSVELPLPGAAIEVGLKLAVTPAGSPEAESETAELKPPLTVVEMVLVPDAP